MTWKLSARRFRYPDATRRPVTLKRQGELSVDRCHLLYHHDSRFADGKRPPREFWSSLPLCRCFQTSADVIIVANSGSAPEKGAKVEFRSSPVGTLHDCIGACREWAREVIKRTIEGALVVLRVSLPFQHFRNESHAKSERS